VRKLLALAIMTLAVSVAAGAMASTASAGCYIYCNQYVKPYFKPSTGSWVSGYWRNSPSDGFRASSYRPYRSSYSYGR
jgi:hypothetical protein